MIGEHITAAAIHAGSAEGYVDWRSDHDGSTYDLLDTPPDVVVGVQRLMQSLDLRYGALDFVVTPTGDWVMLEINAGGQFGFVEDRTGAPLTYQLADLLAGGTR